MNIRLQNGIVIGEYPKGLKLGLNEARRFVDKRLDLQAGKDYPVIIHLNNVICTSRSVRKFLVTEGIRGITRGAFVFRNKYEEILIRFFILIDAPKVPTRIFASEEEAINWIKGEHPDHEAVGREQ